MNSPGSARELGRSALGTVRGTVCLELLRLESAEPSSAVVEVYEFAEVRKAVGRLEAIAAWALVI